jgi:hypothetical protein
VAAQDEARLAVEARMRATPSKPTLAMELADRGAKTTEMK